MSVHRTAGGWRGQGGRTEKVENYMGSNGMEKIEVHRNHRNPSGKRNRSYADVVNNHTEVISNIGSVLSYFSSVFEKDRLLKAYVGKVNVLGSTYGMQTKLEMDGYYSVKVTLLSESLSFGREQKWRNR